MFLAAVICAVSVFKTFAFPSQMLGGGGRVVTVGRLHRQDKRTEP